MLGALDYETKKDLKAAIGETLSYEETSMFGLEFKPNGSNLIVGPNAHRNRKWFAQVECRNGIIIKVK